MAITTQASGTTAQTAGGGEVDIATINVTGLFRLKLDLDLMAAGDVVEVRRYVIVKASGASNLAGFTAFYGVDGGLPGGAKVVTFEDDRNDLAETDALQYTINQPFGTTRELPYGIVRDDGATVTVAAASLSAIADAVLDRNMATGTDSGSPTVRTPRQALRAIRNKAADVDGTLTVYKEDDTTASWTAAISRTEGDPISSVDPAGP